jgi:hypothetical protein
LQGHENLDLGLPLVNQESCPDRKNSEAALPKGDARPAFYNINKYR